MKVKLAFLAVLVAFLVLVMDSSLTAVDTRNIDLVLKKTVLDAQDFEIIEQFMAEAVQELVRERDFTDIARRRAVIISRKSEQGQYAKQFSESAHKSIEAGFVQAEALRPEQRKTNAIINLLILINGLEDLRLADLAAARLTDANAVVRYWAVNCLTNPVILKQLSDQAASGSAQVVAIAGRLKPLIATSGAETLSLIAGFAASVNVPQAEALLLEVADVRIKRYAAWTVKHELSDIALLKALEGEMTAPGSSLSKPAVAQKFAQLFSHAIQRYLKGPVVLNNTQKGHLASVLVEVQEKCVSRLMNAPQTTFRRAIERENMTAISDEHDALLGSGTSPGQLPSRLAFDYGADSDGAKRTAPVPLPDAPRK